LVRKEGDRVVTDIVDLYERDRRIYATVVAGCDLKHSLATEPSEATIAAARAEIARRRAEEKAEQERRFGPRKR
jgi:hypothetical protein